MREDKEGMGKVIEKRSKAKEKTMRTEKKDAEGNQ